MSIVKNLLYYMNFQSNLNMTYSFYPLLYLRICMWLFYFSQKWIMNYSKCHVP